MSMYILVHFIDENSLCVVHRSWIKRIDGKTRVYWPPKGKASSGILTKPFPNLAWETVECEILSECDTIDQAVRRLKRALMNSNQPTHSAIESSSENKRFRSAPSKFNSSSDDCDADFEDDQSQSTAKKASKRSANKSIILEQLKRTKPAVLPKPPPFKGHVDRRSPPASSSLTCDTPLGLDRRSPTASSPPAIYTELGLCRLSPAASLSCTYDAPLGLGSRLPSASLPPAYDTSFGSDCRSPAASSNRTYDAPLGLDSRSPAASSSRNYNAPVGLDSRSPAASSSRTYNAPLGLDSRSPAASSSRTYNAPLGLDNRSPTASSSRTYNAPLGLDSRSPAASSSRTYNASLGLDSRSPAASSCRTNDAPLGSGRRSSAASSSRTYDSPLGLDSRSPAASSSRVINTPKSDVSNITYFEEIITLTREIHRMVFTLVNNEETEGEDILPTPMSTEDEFERFCRDLAQKPYAKKVEHLLKYVGGSSATKTVRRILSKTGTNALWANYSLKGQRDKKSLSGTLMYPIIKRVCMKTHKHTTEDTVDKILGEALKQMPAKKGGPKYKCAKANTVEAEETDNSMDSDDSD